MLRRFFPSGGRNHRKFSLHRPTEGWPGWVGLSGPENIGIVDPSTAVTNPSTNRARRSLTSLMWPTPLPLYAKRAVPRAQPIINNRPRAEVNHRATVPAEPCQVGLQTETERKSQLGFRQRWPSARHNAFRGLLTPIFSRRETPPKPDASSRPLISRWQLYS